MHFATFKDMDKVGAFPSGRGSCPGCGQSVLAKCGQFNVWHWAHENLEDCDSWQHEPMTPWHLKWQQAFSRNRSEIYITKNGESHRADVLTKSNVVIEFQHSSISPDDIIRRENFYDNLIWVIDSAEFKHNLRLKEFLFEPEVEIWLTGVSKCEDGSPYDLKIDVPVSNINGQIEKALITCNYINISQENYGEQTWARVKTSMQQKLEVSIQNAFVAHILDERIQREADSRKIYPTSFKWVYFHKRWQPLAGRLFIDLNNHWLLFIKTLHENGNGFGKLISKHKFLEKYNLK